MAAGIMMLVPACKDQKPKKEIITTKYVPKRLQAPIAMPADVRTSEADWLQRSYSVRIERVASDSLPLVKDETGQQFVDNRITVIVGRQDGSTFFKKVFTKSSFASYLDDSFRQNALLRSMIFLGAKGKELEFAVSVSLPESDDEFIPLKLSVDNLRGIHIERDTDLDTSGDTTKTATIEN